MRTRSASFPLVAALVGTFLAVACGSTVTPSGVSGTTGTGGASSTVGHGGFHASTSGQGGHGGAPMKACPMTPPNNMDSCAGFMLGAQCNYGSSSSGTLTSTECQCSGVPGGGMAWSCGTEAVGVATGAGSTTSSSSG